MTNIEAIKAMESKTIEEMQEYLLNNTDHKTINELLRAGTEWNDAVRLAYIHAIQNA